MLQRLGPPELIASRMKFGWFARLCSAQNCKYDRSRTQSDRALCCGYHGGMWSTTTFVGDVDGLLVSSLSAGARLNARYTAFASHIGLT